MLWSSYYVKWPEKRTHFRNRRLKHLVPSTSSCPSPLHAETNSSLASQLLYFSCIFRVYNTSDICMTSPKKTHLFYCRLTAETLHLWGLESPDFLLWTLQRWGFSPSFSTNGFDFDKYHTWHGSSLPRVPRPEYRDLWDSQFFGSSTSRILWSIWNQSSHKHELRWKQWNPTLATKVTKEVVISRLSNDVWCWVSNKNIKTWVNKNEWFWRWRAESVSITLWCCPPGLLVLH